MCKVMCAMESSPLILEEATLGLEAGVWRLWTGRVLLLGSWRRWRQRLEWRAGEGDQHGTVQVPGESGRATLCTRGGRRGPGLWARVLSPWHGLPYGRKGPWGISGLLLESV